MCFLLTVLVKEMKIAENRAALFVPVLLTAPVGLYTKSSLYCLISPDTSRTTAPLAAVGFTVSHCSAKRGAGEKKTPLCENAT